MNKSEPLVSVIVPCYNERNYIKKSILSIAMQDFTLGEFEIIIVDGLSNDGTRKIIYQLMQKFSKIKLIDNIKRNAPAALNLGINAAKGKYISILGAHSEYDSHFLSNSIQLFEEHPEISCSGGPIISKGEKDFGIAAALAMSHPIGVGNAKHRFPHYEGYAEGACFPTFKKEIFEKIGFYDESLIRNQDDEFNFRLIRDGGKIFISPLVKSFYFVRENPAALFSQYFQYGFWRVKTIKKHGGVLSLRQIIPSFFFLLMSVMFLLGILIPVPYGLIMYLLPVLYLLAISIIAVKIFFSNNIKIGANFFFAVIILHFSYALGFITSFFNRN